MSKLTPTAQQQEIIEAALDGEDLVIGAYAGAAKSSTLVMIAQEKDKYGGGVGLYLSFNKAIAVEAQGKFPSSVDCRTVHSLAYGATSKALIKKMKNPRIFPKQLAEMFEFSGSFVHGSGEETKWISANQKCSMANKTIAKFCNSADDKLSLKHVCKLDWMLTPVGHSLDFKSVLEEVVVIANKIWDATVDENHEMPMTFDAMLKLYSMSGKRVIADYIMIDENQDSSPAILKIIENQTDKVQKIYVGDEHQAIYGWRGAINAMDLVTGEKRFLSKSFRFGDNVQNLANLFLTHSGCELPLEGNGFAGNKTEIFQNKQRAYDAYICRTNAGVIETIFDVTDRFPHKSVKASCNLDEIKSFVFSYLDVMKGKKTDHALLCVFKDRNELAQYCDDFPEDTEISGMVRLIEKFSATTLIKAVERCEKVKEPDIIITTAHKSKGLEWDSVCIMDDFFYEVDSETSYQIDREEMNLIYVACTRAMKDINVYGIADLIFALTNVQNKVQLSLDLGFTSDFLDPKNPNYNKNQEPVVGFVADFPEDEEEDQYGDDDAARATGGVTTQTHFMPDQIPEGLELTDFK